MFISSSALAGVVQNATLTLQVTNVVNDNGGTAVISDFDLQYFSNGGWTPASGAPTGDPLVTGVSVVPGYTALGVFSYSMGYYPGQWSCEVTPLEGQPEIELTDYSITLDSGDIAVCSVEVDDQSSYLTLEKYVTNDDGGLAEDTDWTLTATNTSDVVVLTGEGYADGEVDGGEYQLAEIDGPPGYIAGDWECQYEGKGGPQQDSKSAAVPNGFDPSIEVIDGVVQIPNGEYIYCSITNDDTPPTLTLSKVVINDDGGIAEPSDFTLQVVGQSNDTNISGAAGSPEVTDIALPVGDYFLYEADGPDGYTWDSWECDGGGLEGNSINLVVGDDVTCTVTNDDLPGHLQLVKALVLDNGGSAAETDWTLTATGSVSSLTGTSGVEGDVNAGDYQLTESGGPAGYTANGWICETILEDRPERIGNSPMGIAPSTDGFVSIANGENVVCTVTNDDNQPGLTLVKVVDGGEAVPADFALTLTGADGTHTGGVDYASGDTPVVSAGVQYEVSEAEGQVEDYFLESIVCTDNADQNVIAQPFTLAVGQGVTCTVTNKLNELIVDVLQEACLNNAPYVNYDVTTTSGVAPDVAITWIKDDGSNEVVETLLNQPTAGQLLWPGAMVVNGEAVAWPGWACDAQGENCTEVVDGLVPTMQIMFEINPTATLVVNYPPATAACQPVIPPPPPPPPPAAPAVPIPVDNALALLLLTLMLMGTGWYMRPAVRRK